MHWKVPFLICKNICQGRGEGRWTESKEEEKRRLAASRGWLTGMEGRRFHGSLVLTCFGAVCVSLFLLLSLEKLLQQTPTKQRHKYTSCGDTSEGRCWGMGWERHALALHWIIQPVINYNLASQRHGLGEFLCWSGVQLIVFFLPVQSAVRAEQRPNRGTGCLHVWHGPSLLGQLHNMKVFNENGRHSADSSRAMRV